MKRIEVKSQKLKFKSKMLKINSLMAGVKREKTFNHFDHCHNTLTFNILLLNFNF